MKQIQGPPPALPRLMPRLTMVSGWAAALVLGLTAGWLHRQNGPTFAPPGTVPVIEHGNPSIPTIDQRIDSEVKSQLDEMRGHDPSAGARRTDEPKPVRRWPPKSY
jgi:hypothetical protein